MLVREEPAIRIPYPCHQTVEEDREGGVGLLLRSGGLDRGLESQHEAKM